MYENFQKHPRMQPLASARPVTEVRGPRPSASYVRAAAFALATLLVANACGPKAEDPGGEVQVWDGLIVTFVKASPDSLMESISRVMVQERIDLQRYDPAAGVAVSTFIDLARYPMFFDAEIWGPTERLVKLRFYTSSRDTTTLFQCEPLYSPSQIITHEIDAALLQRVPEGHPGFAIAAALTRRIAAHAEGRAVTWP